MLDIKECRKIKRDYTKDNTEKKIIINIEGFPFCYMIVTHGNGKSWGYFFRGSEHLFLGMSNQIVDCANLEIKQYSVSDDSYDLELIGGNDAIKSVYSRLIKSFDRYHWYRNSNGSRDLCRAFKINPTLFANLIDCNVLRGTGYYATAFDNLDRLYRYSGDFDYTKPLIKDACKLPPKWLRLLFNTYSDLEYVKLLRKYNYSIEELSKEKYRWHVSDIPVELIPNREAGLKYISDSLYRDYFTMRHQLSDETKRQFPIFPKNVKKYHDLIIPVYNREQAYRRERELQEKQDLYIKNVYNEAEKLNYSDENFIIKACEKLVELLFEGSTLRHCVGSYVNSVSQGREYILFLRKVSDPDTPYFTIDVTPEGQVRQIHGLCNCNMSDDIKPFVNEWANKFKLNLEGCSGVRCALY